MFVLLIDKQNACAEFIAFYVLSVSTTYLPHYHINARIFGKKGFLLLNPCFHILYKLFVTNLSL